MEKELITTILICLGGCSPIKEIVREDYITRSGEYQGFKVSATDFGDGRKIELSKWGFKVVGEDEKGDGERKFNKINTNQSNEDIIGELFNRAANSGNLERAYEEVMKER